jgi:hypothetical protein
MTRSITHDSPQLGPACENCNLFETGCPVRAEGVDPVTARSWCSDWIVRARRPRPGPALTALNGIPLPGNPRF